MLLAECWASVAAGLFSLLHIPVTLVSIGLAHLVIAVLLIYNQRKRGLGLQKIDIRYTDIALGVVLLVLILVIGYFRFFAANPIIFVTVDPAERFGNAMTIAVTQSVITDFPNQYFIQLTGSLFIQTLQPFAPTVLPFRFFEFKDLFNLWFTGALFYGAVSIFMRSRFSKITAFLLTFVFILAYPWMGQLYGFVYPGVATNLVLLVLIAFALLFKEDLGRIPAYVIVSIACFGLGVCYTLYAPPLFLAAFLSIAVYEYQRSEGLTTKIGFLRNLAITELAIFIIPTAWTIVNAFVFDMGGEYNVSNSITAEGAIYRNLFTEFIPYAPLALWFIWYQLSKRKWDFPLFFSLIFAVYQIAIFGLMITGRVSTYYYYKLYYATWLIFLLLTCLAIDALIKHGGFKRLIIVYAICWGLIAGLGVSGADYIIESRRPLSNPEPRADTSFMIYSSNLLFFTPPGEYNPINYDWAFIDLCTKARELSGPVDEDAHIEIVTDNFQDTFWKDALTSQLLIPRSGLPEIGAGVWIVLYESSYYSDSKEYFDGFDRLFENERGFIIQPN